MVIIIYDIIDVETKKVINNICNNSDISNYGSINNTLGRNYVRLFVNNELLTNYLDSVKHFINEHIELNKLGLINFENSKSWINKVNTETNLNDTFHTDKSDLSIITYLNSDYTGGELLYIDETNQKQIIKPKENMTLVMNNKLLHKVMPVVNGTRFSLVTFFKFKETEKKSLI